MTALFNEKGPAVIFICRTFSFIYNQGNQARCRAVVFFFTFFSASSIAALRLA